MSYMIKMSTRGPVSWTPHLKITVLDIRLILVTPLSDAAVLGPHRFRFIAWQKRYKQNNMIYYQCTNTIPRTKPKTVSSPRWRLLRRTKTNLSVKRSWYQPLDTWTIPCVYILSCFKPWFYYTYRKQLEPMINT